MTTATQQKIDDWQALHQCVGLEHKELPFRNHLGMSQIGAECHRALWFGFRWTLVPNFDPRIVRLFRTGHEYEPRFAGYLRSIGIKVQDVHPETGAQFRYVHADGHVGGSSDGFGLGFVEYPDEWVLLEYKTMGEKAFADIMKHGLKKSKPVYWTQVHSYMRKSGKLTKCFFMAVNKNTDALYTEWVILDEAHADEKLALATDIVYNPIVPERVALSSTDYRCRMCDYRPTCWHRNGENSEPALNCRTCSHSFPSTEGTWTCGYSGATDIDCYNPCGAYEKHDIFVKEHDIIINIKL